MSLSSGVQGTLWSSSCNETFKLYTFSSLCFLEGGKNVLLGRQTFPSSVTLNTSLPLFSVSNPMCRTLFFFFFLFF